MAAMGSRSKSAVTWTGTSSSVKYGLLRSASMIDFFTCSLSITAKSSEFGCFSTTKLVEPSKVKSMETFIS